MLSTVELVEMFEYGSQPYAQIYRAKPPTDASIAKVSAELGIRLPAEFLSFAALSPSYGAWFASLGEDYDSLMHILRLNESFHDRRTPGHLPSGLVMFNHGHDGHCDCFDITSPNAAGEYPLIYHFVPEPGDTPMQIPTFSLAASFHEYLETVSVRMKKSYDEYLRKKKGSTGC